jgi:hypothetical protein
MSNPRVLRNKTADISEVVPDEIEMEREKRIQVLQLDESERKSDSNCNVAANQIPPTNSEQARNETEVPATVLSSTAR